MIEERRPGNSRLVFNKATKKIVTERSDKKMANSIIPLGKAIWILSQVHTREAPEIGFEIIVGATPSDSYGVSDSDYTEAWRSLRYNAGLPAEPEDYK